MSDNIIRKIKSSDNTVYDIYDSVALHETSVAEAYSSSSTYSVGDFVIYDNKLYKCTTAISTAEAWTAAHWTEVKVMDSNAISDSDIHDITGLPTVTVGTTGATLSFSNDAAEYTINTDGVALSI